MTTPTELPHDLATLAEQARQMRAACDDLIEYLKEAADVQWQPSPIPRPRDDTSERALGEHSDPTADVATDPRRQAVRAVFLDGTLALIRARIAASAVRRHLEVALDEWAGRA